MIKSLTSITINWDEDLSLLKPVFLQIIHRTLSCGYSTEVGGKDISYTFLCINAFKNIGSLWFVRSSSAHALPKKN